ncbi:hypothetical protein ATEG_06144 [Aspergillus terreus NIH2624]|uniref:Uncharacterized protein n=1 Tax=Aspergillus terreus (strain NIH 2624 / FGSC A1156) TaxID=341663 RepID=Q0CJJ0_ASPTN|nr:uncharacterized protein ATEG_06144 [Aspergillus terreus NIH2624]EAU33905.1 hypothetical protein ATEG_06144 [Aspergillus terreus NIH2624]
MKYSKPCPYPFQPWSQGASIRSSPSEASPTNTVAIPFSFGSSCDLDHSLASMPAPPPPSPTDSLLDITPRKGSFSAAFGVSNSNSCAFPSWPNRPSLINSAADVCTTSAFISDEELDFDLSPMSDAPVDEESAVRDPLDLTTEQQIQMIRAAAEEEAQRARLLAQVHAHARAQQALRVAQLAALERENAKRRKRKAIVEKKRRTTSASKATRA